MVDNEQKSDEQRQNSNCEKKKHNDNENQFKSGTNKRSLFDLMKISSRIPPIPANITQMSESIEKINDQLEKGKMNKLKMEESMDNIISHTVRNDIEIRKTREATEENLDEIKKLNQEIPKIIDKQAKILDKHNEQIYILNKSSKSSNSYSIIAIWISIIAIIVAIFGIVINFGLNKSHNTEDKLHEIGNSDEVMLYLSESIEEKQVIIIDSVSVKETVIDTVSVKISDEETKDAKTKNDHKKPCR